ncbi:MAG TPA: tetratricopeptide repeat protein [Bacteroidia bacterium]|jgi:tetratricopeptide (TPR) repeat protein|nr:tetratricopeptide repeat protein [Bacteroidia bacterium]
MKNALTRTQFAFIGGAVLITVLLCYARRTPDKTGEGRMTMMSGHAGNNSAPDHSSAGNYLDSSLVSLSDKDRVHAKELRNNLDKASLSDKPVIIDKLVALFDTLQKPAASAYYMQMKAVQTNSKSDWTKTAERYYVGSKYFPGAHVLVDSAIRSYERVLKLDPNDLNAKTGLGVCYVEGTSNPMQGIGLLQEVLKADSNYVDALLNLGNFAMTSGQYPKAISRFNKVLKLKPEYILLYVRIAEAYEKMGDKPHTIEYLEKYVKVEDDVMLKTSIQNEINKLKNS